jgi:hypothetical protein
MTVDSLSTGDNHIDAFVSVGTGEFQQIEIGEPQSIGQVTTGHSDHPICYTIRDMPNPVTKLEGKTAQPVMDMSSLLEGWGQVEVESKSSYDISYSSLSAWARSPGVRAYQDLSSNGAFLGANMVHKVYFNLKSDSVKELILSNIGVRSQEVMGNQATFMTFYYNGWNARV